MADELLDSPASEIVAAAAARQVGAVELARAAIARIESRDSQINAVVVRDFDRALDAAAEADRAIARGETAPLLGLPMTVKEGYNVAGLPTTWGIEAFRGWIAQEDAVAVQRLKTAGAVILGKSNVPVGLADWQAMNPIYGRTSNPWDSGRSPGGSSGGSAAVLAARMVPLELGSDIAGSIRVPAAFCGVYGHKPSYGLIPRRGHSPPGADGAPLPFAVLGPMARNAADLGLSMTVLAGPDAAEAKALRLALPPSRHAALSDFRVLVVDSHPAAKVDGEICAALARLADRLAALGTAVDRNSAKLPDLAAFNEAYLKALFTVMSRNQPGATSMPAHDYLALLDIQVRARRTWAALFEDYDVVLAPAFGVVAFPHNDEADQDKRRLTIDGSGEPFVNQMAWPGLASFANLPVTAIPVGLTEAGLPIGCQVIGPYLEDRTTIVFAGLVEREFGGFVAPPGF